MDLDLTLRVPAAEKLVDYAASGIGTVAGLMLASLRARIEANARRIEAAGEADSLKVIAAAQLEARAALTAPASSVQGELSIGETVSQRIQFQEEKRQRNIGSVVGQAYLTLADKEVPDLEPNPDWTARFFNDVQDISSEGMQVLWAKILAGEVERPGSTSLHTLSVLKDLDQATAVAFKNLCSMCSVVRYGDSVDARVPSLGGNAGTNSLQAYGLAFPVLNNLNEHDLIISDFNSSLDYGPCVSPDMKTVSSVFSFQGRNWGLLPLTQDDIKEVEVSGVALTRAGWELSSAVGGDPRNDYAQALMEFFRERHLQMVEVHQPT